MASTCMEIYKEARKQTTSKSTGLRKQLHKHFLFSSFFYLFLLGNDSLSLITADSSSCRCLFLLQFPLTGLRETDFCTLNDTAFSKHWCRLGFTLRPPRALYLPKFSRGSCEIISLSRNNLQQEFRHFHK